MDIDGLLFPKQTDYNSKCPIVHIITSLKQESKFPNYTFITYHRYRELYKNVLLKNGAEMKVLKFLIYDLRKCALNVLISLNA